MKRGTPRHPKVLELASILKVPRYSAVGLLEMLWHFTAEFALDGNIGKFTDEAICSALCYDNPSINLIDALVQAGFIDRCQCHRLRVHDWKDHADQTVERVLAKRKQSFIVCYDDPSTVLAPSKMPLPLPKAFAFPIASDPPTEDQVDAATPASPKKRKSPGGLNGTEIWASYSSAYQKRYGALPIRNARQNALCKQLRARLGHEAPDVAAFYLSSRNAYYTSRGHTLQCLVADAEKVRTEWATGRQATQAAAREDDRLEKERVEWEEVIKERHGGDKC